MLLNMFIGRQEKRLIIILNPHSELFKKKKMQYEDVLVAHKFSYEHIHRINAQISLNGYLFFILKPDLDIIL